MNKTYKPTGPLLGEAIFDILYLLFDLVAASIFFINADGSKVFMLFGFLTLLLGGGDAFHLIPRIIHHLKGPSVKRTYYMDLGILISSVTMTFFYIVLYYIFITAFPNIAVSKVYPALIWGTALFRIIACLFPQNGWFKHEENRTWSLIRNLPFAVTGFMVMMLYFKAPNFLSHMGIAIILSFGFYFPVTLWAKKKPALGALMMPKTLAYVWMISLGLKLL